MARPTTSKPAAVQLYGFDTSDAPVGLACDDDGNLTLAANIDIDTTGLATAANQATTNTKLDTLIGHVDTLEAKLTALADPTTYTAITPSDSTDVTATCTKGIFVAVTGNVNITGVGGSAVSLGTQLAGTTIPGALSRVNAATTATVFGLSGP